MSPANTPDAAAAPQKRYKIEPPYYPIVYVRGYAMSSGERDDTFHDGYYGFATTSVRKRQGPPDPDRYLVADVFEGQLLRFVKDFGYADAINRGNRIERPPRQAIFNPSRSLWISRFYDADVLGQKLRSIEEHAADLKDLICDIIPAELKALGMDLGDQDNDYRVILLAHSMGGLVCRTVMQNLLPRDGEEATRWVHRFVTMGTPHGGIELGSLPDGLQHWVMNSLNPGDASIFSPNRMRAYLNIPETDDVHSVAGHFPVHHCLCLIGSDYKDYAVGDNLVRRATGSFSDGLVKQDKAYLVTGPKPMVSGDKYSPDRVAFSANVHKAHSGYEGIVNSYESWENIHRFLFGDVQARIELDHLILQTPPPDQSRGERVFYDVECAVSIRGTNTKMHWRAQDPCENAIRVAYEELQRQAVPLHTLFLNTALRPELSSPFDAAEAVTIKEPDGYERQFSRYLYFKLTVRVVEHRVREVGGELSAFRRLIGIDSDYDGSPIYAEALELRVDVAKDSTDAGPSFAVEYRWFADATDPDAAPWKTDAQRTAVPGGFDYRFPLRGGGALSGEFVVHAQAWQPEVWQKATE